MHYPFNFQVRLEHILERIALISEAASTEKPSAVTSYLFIGGALAARSVYTMQYLGITHILCLCTNEIGQSETQFPDIFEYKNFSVIHHVHLSTILLSIINLLLILGYFRNVFILVLFTIPFEQVCDSEDFNITTVFEEACDFIDCVEQKGQKILVHCFEGKSRSVTLVLAYLMLRK
jgi:atypical dual specificity phosphatase